MIGPLHRGAAVSRRAREGKFGVPAAPPRVEQLVASVRARLAAQIDADEARLAAITAEANAVRTRIGRGRKALGRLDSEARR